MYIYVCIHIDGGMPRCVYSHCDDKDEQLTSIKGVSAHTTHTMNKYTHTTIYVCMYT